MKKQPQRIGIDVRLLNESNYSGVKEYTYNLLLNLFKTDQKNIYILFYNSFKKTWPKELLYFEKFPNVFIRKFKYPNKLLNFSFIIFDFPKIDKLINTKILFFPNLIFYSASKKTKIYFTVHDLTFIKFNEFLNSYRKFWHWLINLKKIIKQSQKIITVSNSSKQDLIDYFNKKTTKNLKNKEKNKIKLKNKIKVIYPGLSDSIKTEINKNKLKKIQKKYGLPKNFLFFIGTLEPRKNINAILKAFYYLKEKKLIKDSLVIVGKRGWKFESIKKTLEKIQGSKHQKNLILIDSIEDQERKYFYYLSQALIYPSFYEGFGFPPLEALALNRPIICSKNSSLAEIYSGQAIFVNPYKAEEIAQAMLVVTNNLHSNFTSQTPNAILKNKFSWPRYVNNFLRIIKSEL
jgi:glycosyltransferase involved in cell wall biosynthesis